MNAAFEALERDDFVYSSAHTPAYLLQPPAGAYTITILRDPVARVVSYYRYLLWARANPSDYANEPYIDDVVMESRFIDGGLRYTAERLRPAKVRTESAVRELGLRQFAERLLQLPRPGSGFSDFLRRVPPRKLTAQLYMFSKALDPSEAAEAINECNAVCFTETFRSDLARIAGDLGLPLRERHKRRVGDPVELDQADLDELREMLTPEYEMLAMVERVSPVLL